MKIERTKGRFLPNEALELLTQLVHTKIRFLEMKISSSSSEEDIKMRENRIKELQRGLYEAKKHAESCKGLDLNVVIEY